MAAATVMRLQGVVSREVAGDDTAVVTVGALRAGTKENIIPDDADLLLVFDPGPVTGSEDVGLFAIAAGAPCVYWLLGGADPGHFAGVTSRAGIAAAVRDLASNHSPRYAPVLQPTLATGVAALATAVRTWLPPG